MCAGHCFGAPHTLPHTHSTPPFQRGPVPEAPSIGPGGEREAYTACAGYALGLICLGASGGEARPGHPGPRDTRAGGGEARAGREARPGHPGPRDTLGQPWEGGPGPGRPGPPAALTDALVRLMVGGRESWPVGGGPGRPGTREGGGPDGTALHPADGGAPTPVRLSGGRMGRPVLVRESPGVINTHITALPATLALALMYMRSGNASVAAALALPPALAASLSLRYDVALLRVTGECVCGCVCVCVCVCGTSRC